jgi:hypothetical protein
MITKYRYIQLIYKASIDGFNSNIYHQRCDNKQPTMTIVKLNNGKMIGGFTEFSWITDNNVEQNWSEFGKGFLYNFTDNIYLERKGTRNTLRNWPSGPVFGSGFDMKIDLNNLTNSYVNSNGSYGEQIKNILGLNGMTYFQGEYTIIDVEIYLLT